MDIFPEMYPERSILKGDVNWLMKSDFETRQK